MCDAALDRDAGERTAFVAAACGHDQALRQDVEALLAHAHTAEGFLVAPMGAVAAHVLTDSGASLVGRQISSYTILSHLGTGGMGEVYRARDGKLGRDVAIKVLPASFANDPDRLARLSREARLLAALSHPHIATIHGLEEGDGVRALVMELVEGPTLAERLAHDARRTAKAGLPIAEALKIGGQIAEALEAAHEKGVIHRDLKPANIKFSHDGNVKVLDFGLATPFSSDDSGGDPSHLPTITATELHVGAIVGTPAYMSPEQARGQAIDKRTDIWAFGCVLYEMLAGRAVFPGETISDTIAAVLEREPEWSALPAQTPAGIGQLLRRCLDKDPKRRLRDIGDARIEIDDALTTPSGDVTAAVPRRSVWRRSIPIATGLFVVALLAAGGVLLLTRPAPASIVRTTVTTSGSTALSLQGGDRDIAITPDGSRVVYRSANQLLVRALNQLEPTVLTSGAPRGVFVSPDGQWVGFFDPTTIKRVAITGGPPVTVSMTQGIPRGATWGEDGTIIFATNSPVTGLQRVSAAGGETTVLTKPDHDRGEGDHSWPEFLPGGTSVLFTIVPADGSIENAQIAVLDLKTGTSKVLIRSGSHAQYVPTGHLVYGLAGRLLAVAFDLGRLEVVGTPAPVLEGVVTTGLGAADFAVAANGSLVYVPGVAGSSGQQTIVAVDRRGRASPLPGLTPGSYRDVRVSPNGERLALATATDVWTYDFARATLSRLTTNPAQDTRPLWTPDGQRIIFTSNRSGHPELFWRAADGTGSEERLLSRAEDILELKANGWSADGTQLLFSENPPSTLCAIGQIAIARPSDAEVLIKNAFCNDWAAVSPNGRWMAYSSNLSGRGEIYVERYPELGNRQQISTEGGRIPLWSRNGRELFFGSTDGRQMFAVEVQSGTTLVAGRPQPLFEFAMLTPAAGARAFDLAPDGRFLIIRSAQADAGGGTASNMIVVQNWFEELKRLVPVN